MGVSAGSHSLTGETEDAVQWSTSLMIKKLLCERRGKKKRRVDDASDRSLFRLTRNAPRCRSLSEVELAARAEQNAGGSECVAVNFVFGGKAGGKPAVTEHI